MKHIILISLLTFTTIVTNAQSTGNEKFAIKAGAEIGLGNAVSTTSSIGSISSKSSSCDYGVEFGWAFWKKHNNRLELNIGVAYSPTSLKLDLSTLDYNYSAPASADMDGDTYQRYYELNNVRQKVSCARFTIPIYFTYAYKCNDWLAVHADLGLRLGFKTGSKVKDVDGEAYSYGVYPQYGNLLINDPFLNEFGITNLAETRYGEPLCNGFSTSLLIGVGGEFRIYQHLAADLSLRYNPGVTNLFKGQCNGSDFTDESVPVKYTVETGQQVKSLTDYLNSSKLRSLSLRIALIYRF